MASKRKRILTTEIVTYDKPTGQVNHFNNLECTISVWENKDLGRNLSKINHVCETMRTVLNNKTRKEAQIKSYKTTDITALTYSSETGHCQNSRGKRQKQQK
jgi:hypothetical protein